MSIPFVLQKLKEYPEVVRNHMRSDPDWEKICDFATKYHESYIGTDDGIEYFKLLTDLHKISKDNITDDTKSFPYFLMTLYNYTDFDFKTYKSFDAFRDFLSEKYKLEMSTLEFIDNYTRKVISYSCDEYDCKKFLYSLEEYSNYIRRLYIEIDDLLIKANREDPINDITNSTDKKDDKKSNEKSID